MIRRTVGSLVLCIVACAVAVALPATPLCAAKMRTHTAPGLGAYDAPFLEGGTYRGDVQSPTEFLGFELGSVPMRHEHALRYFRYLSGNFSNAYLAEYGSTYEGRKLFYLTVTSESHAQDLEGVRERIGKLADPRKSSGDGEATDIIKTTPAVAWMAYGIHGDELSSCDAAVQLAYQLLAGTDDVTRNIRDNVVVCIDPMQNPDGRMRWLKQMEQWNSVVPNTDVESLHHRGVWPWGRGNHYLFDLNRDWFTQVHPESRGRIDAILKWNPQFLLDCHEMGPLNTYLFSPPREPFNPFLISQIHKWWDVYSKDQADAFDAHGWSYYTREWNEELFPGYGSSWGSHIGAIGMLYEQAGVDGSAVKRRDGSVMSYRETVHHQFTSSMANLQTTADHRAELLSDFYEEKKRDVGGRRKGAAYVVAPSANRSRVERLAETLQRQNIEVEVAEGDFKLGRATSASGKVVKGLVLPRGSLIIRVNQPMRSLLETILAFDIRLPTDFLETQRKELLKHNRTRLYENTGWSLLLGYNLECYRAEAVPGVKTTPWAPAGVEGRVIGGPSRYGYAVDNADDRSFVLLARLFERGYRIWAARKKFIVDGRSFGPGSFVLRNSANPSLEEADLEALARETGVHIYSVNTALGRPEADLGGAEFTLLQKPRIGLVGGTSISTYGFGAIWHMLDSRVNYMTSTLEATSLGRMDLRKYNVIILPHSAGPSAMKQLMGKGGIKKLKTWVKDGGTLIANRSSAAFLADSSVAVSSVRQKRQVLKKLAEYDSWREWSVAAESPEIDSLDLWDAKKEGTAKKEEESKRDFEALKQEDELARRLRPRGVILSAVLDDTHWLAFGERSPLPVMVSTGYTYLDKRGVEVAARYAREGEVRMSGLLWPEARRRWSETAYATREPLGGGQIILFAGHPNFRAYFHGGERLLQNAIFLGPGLGTSTEVEW
ncbi:MAG: M14 family metallopeptidase [Candidatus Krumholzibacteriia bacterium]